jgi:tRNA(His) guanylyltransferase
MTDKKDSLGDRMKMYESATTSRVIFKGQPVVARLDGKSFHSFTKGLQRPYDERLRNLMVLITKKLVETYGAQIGYHQSDEITLIWWVESDSHREYPFGGRVQKFESILASTASAIMNKHLEDFLPEKKNACPVFDCRTFAVPNLTEAYNCLVWRQQDCVKNAITMAASAFFSPKQLFCKTGEEKQEMLFQKGINFNDYPHWFKRGSFVKREKVLKELEPEILEKIPENFRPTEPIIRTIVQEKDYWLTKLDNPVTVLFMKKEI